MANKTKVFIIESHPAILESLVLLTGQSPLFEVAGSAASTDGVSEQLETLTVDLLITNIAMSGVSGLALAELLRGRFPALKIVILSNIRAPSVVRSALQAGVNGYISKDTRAEDFFNALERVMRGETVVLVQNEQMPAEWLAGAPELSKRQTEILCLLCDGYSSREIAAKLAISPHTVNVHVAKIKLLLKLNTLPDLIDYTVRNEICK